LTCRAFDTAGTVLACYGGSGFDAELLTAAAGDDKVLLVDTHRPYD
jgi:uncharacterized protein